MKRAGWRSSISLPDESGSIAKMGWRVVAKSGSEALLYVRFRYRLASGGRLPPLHPSPRWPIEHGAVIVGPLASNLLRGYPIPSLNPSATRSWCGTSTGGKFRRPPVPSCGRSLRDSSKICSAIPKCSFCASKFDSLCNFAVAAVCEHSEKPRIAFLESLE